jgi:mono/diheme cytochrome c family protein
MSRRRPLIFLISRFGWILVGGKASLAGEPAAGKIIFETRCHGCHAALPYTGRVGEANLPAFLANPLQSEDSHDLSGTAEQKGHRRRDRLCYRAALSGRRGAERRAAIASQGLKTAR